MMQINRIIALVGDENIEPEERLFHLRRLGREVGDAGELELRYRQLAAAVVDKSRWQCQNCHAEQINRPSDFPQFSKTGWIGKEVRKHRRLDAETPCLKCHNAHDPAN